MEIFQVQDALLGRLGPWNLWDIHKENVGWNLIGVLYKSSHVNHFAPIFADDLLAKMPPNEKFQ
jgi:hypothetical protein